jgi:hypothetical protein
MMKPWANSIKQGMCQLHYGLAIYIKKGGILRQKEEIWKLIYLTMQK